MKVSFKVSKYTILFSIYVIISSSFMYQVLNVIRYDLWIPKKITDENFEDNILNKLNEIQKEKENKKEKLDDIKNKIEIMKKSYIKNIDGCDYLYKKTSIEDKEEIRYVFLILDKKDILPVFIWIVFGIFGCILLFYLIRLKVKILRIILVCITFALGLLYAYTINQHFSERIHLIYFGVIGFLFTKDNFDDNQLWTILYTMLWVMIIAALDEIFQLYLPKRVGDVRDIIFGVIGGIWGGMVYMVLNVKSLFKYKRITK